MATLPASSEMEFDAIPDVQFDAIPDQPVFDAIPDEVSPELVQQEAERASQGAVQALDVMAAPQQFDWTDVREGMDQQRFREAQALKAEVADKISTPERRATFAKAEELLSQISPDTEIGRYLAAQQAGKEQAAIEIGATAERGSTPSSLLSGFMGPGLSATAQPVVESAARNIGPAAGGALGAALYTLPAAHPLAFIASLAGGFLGSQAGAGVQEEVLKSAETPEETEERRQRTAEDIARNPMAARLGAIGASSPFFGPSLAQFGRAAAGDRGAIVNLGIAGGVGAGSELALGKIMGQEVSIEDVLTGALGNMILNEPTRLGRRLGFKPSTEQAAVEAAAKYEQAPIRIGGGLELESGLRTRPTTSTADVFSSVQRQTGEPNAQQISETSAPDGGVRAPEIAPEDVPLPSPEGGEGVQPSGQGEPLVERAPEAPREVTQPIPVEEATAAAASKAPADIPRATSNKEVVVNAERAERMLDPVIKEAAIENPNAINYAERAIEANPDRPQEIINRLRTNPMERSISLEDGAILLVERTKIRTARDNALARIGREDTAMGKAIAEAEFNLAESRLNDMDQAAQDARSTWGRFGQLWQRSMREDFSLENLKRRARKSKDGPLSEKDLSKLKEVSEKAQAAHDAIAARKVEIAAESAKSAIDSKISEVTGKEAQVDPAVKSLADRIVARLEVASKNAEKSLRSKLFQLGSSPDVSIILDVAKIAAARTAKGAIEFGQWSAEMIKKFGQKVEPFLQAGWDQRDQHIDTAIDAGAGKKKKEVAARVKKTKSPLDAAQQQARIETAIGNRIKEGKELSSLAPYVNKLQESFISQGVTDREGLIDAVHGTLLKHDPAITRDDAMEIMSKYGSDYATPLSRDPVKMTRREVDGQIQQLLKLRDIGAGVPLPKSGPERPAPGPVWRSLIKAVNAAKKKMGVVVNDPETQLKTSQDAIRTRLRNEIEDMTLEIETGVKSAEKSDVEYAQDMEILKGVRDRVRQTLRDIEGNPNLTDEQRIAMTKRGAEASLEMWQRRLAGEEAKSKKGISTPEIEAIRAQRDAVKAEVEELNAADAVLQENKKSEAIVRQIKAVEDQLANNAKNVKGETQGADSALVSEALEQLRVVREALDIKRQNDPQRQLEAIQKAEQTLEASIKKLDSRIQAGDLSTKGKGTRLQSERLEYLRAQRDAMNKLMRQMREEARPRLSPDELAIKSFTSRALARAAELRKRMASGDFGPRTRKTPVDISNDRKALDAQADLMNVDAEFQKMQEQWKLDQMNWVQKRWRNVGQTWDAASNVFLSMDLSAPLQTAFAMASHPIEGLKAIGKGAEAFRQQFFKNSDAYARREAARIANSTNSKNGLYKAMGLELPSPLGKKREENMASVLEQLADLDARWAGLPDVVKGLYGLKGRELIKGGKRLASVAPKVVGLGIKASNAAFETIANTMRARTADAMLARWYKRGPGPTKQQLQLLGEQVNIATGKGGLKGGDSVRRLLFAPNYYLSILKQLSGYQLLKSGVYHLEGRVAKNIATEYVRAIATMGGIYGLNALFGNQVELDPRDKNFLRATTDEGTSVDLSMGRGAWATALTQIATGERIDKRGRVVDQDRKQTALNFVGGRLNRGVSTSLTTAFGKDYKGKDLGLGEIAKDFVLPLSWRDFDDVIEREGFTRGSFLQLLNVLGINYRIAE